jgi:hypothetical protein
MIQDIWNKRTWRHATIHLWDTKFFENEFLPPPSAKPDKEHSITPKPIGRPPGSKDSRPRSKRKPVKTIFESAHVQTCTHLPVENGSCDSSATFRAEHPDPASETTSNDHFLRKTMRETISESSLCTTLESTCSPGLKTLDESSGDCSGTIDEDDLTRTFPFFLSVR